MRTESDDSTVVWDIARWLLLGCATALVVAAWFAFRPIENPGVQRCGGAVEFLVRNEGNVALPIGADATSETVRLAAQTPCSELVNLELRRAGLAAATGVALGLLGATLGLADDRVRYRRAPRFESLLRPRPVDAPSRALDPVPTRVDELGEDLPAIEPVEATLLVLGALVSFLVVPAVVGGGAVLEALGTVSAALVFVALLLAVGTRVAAALARRVLGPEVPLGDWIDVSVASGFEGRVRPETGTFGIDLHHLLRRGAPLGRALSSVRTLAAGALVVHLLAFAVIGVLAAPSGLPDTPRNGLWLALVVGVLVLVGVVRLPRRLRATAVLPDRHAFVVLTRRSDPAGPGPAALVAGSAQLLAESATVALVVAAAGVEVGFGTVVWLWVAALALGALSPLPGGAVLVELLLALGLWWAGAPLAAAVAAALVARAITFWLPQLPGWWVGRRLRRTGAL